jgi:sialate O-acetylesterase
VHPRDKRSVGLRLAACALNQVYGRNDIHPRGPVFKRLEARGAFLKLSFELHNSTLATRDGMAPQGFALAGADGVFRPVCAALEVDSVLLPTSGFEFPLYVRYAWADNPICNLRDAEGFPLEPFQTSIPNATSPESVQ